MRQFETKLRWKERHLNFVELLANLWLRNLLLHGLGIGHLRSNRGRGGLHGFAASLLGVRLVLANMQSSAEGSGGLHGLRLALDLDAGHLCFQSSRCVSGLGVGLHVGFFSSRTVDAQDVFVRLHEA